MTHTTIIWLILLLFFSFLLQTTSVSLYVSEVCNEEVLLIMTLARSKLVHAMKDKTHPSDAVLPGKLAESDETRVSGISTIGSSHEVHPVRIFSIAILFKL